MVFGRLRGLFGGQQSSAPSATDDPDIPDADNRSDGLPPDLVDPAAGKLLDAYLKEFCSHRSYWHVKPANTEAGTQILDGEPDMQIAVIEQAIRRLKRMKLSFGWSSTDESHKRATGLQTLLSQLLRRKLPYNADQLTQIVKLTTALSDYDGRFMPLKPLVGAVEKYVAREGRTDNLDAALRKLRKADVMPVREPQVYNAILTRIDLLLGTAEQSSRGLKGTDHWAQLATKMLQDMPEGERQAWDRLLDYCASASASKPAKKWLTEAEPMIAEIGEEAFLAALEAWFAVVGKVPKEDKPEQLVLSKTPVAEPDAVILKGLVWCLGTKPGEQQSAIIADLAENCFKKLAGHGPRSQKVGNACVAVLERVGEMHALAQMSRLKLKIKYASFHKLIDKALSAAAKKQGVTPAQLEELAVPNFGLDAGGIREYAFGDCAGALRVVGLRAELTWQNAAGKAQKSVPAEVKRDFADELKALKALQKDLQSMLSAQRDRIEQFYVRRRTWAFSVWREHYLDHSLCRSLSTRLIWTFSNGDDGEQAGIWWNGDWVDARGQHLEKIEDGTMVRLWHPIDCDADAVLAWRNWLEEHDVTQPFKQAHREIYILTDAERSTDTYSNRFAAHIIRQHQLAALCKQRGWHFTLIGQFDSHNVPEISLPEWDLRVEFWVDAAPDGPATEMGIYQYLSTDQVRFYGQDGPMSLEGVPAMAFTELMRDVDLFVGVCSIGNDPGWHDGGIHHYDRYWQDYAFGELNATASTRREVLARLVPRLKIKDQCKLTDRFLEVQGKFRTYKIHLGSGNILMSPNDRYLCIVQSFSKDSKERANVRLPFEGDTTLSVIISKALLLAADDKIKDPTIISQIK